METALSLAEVTKQSGASWCLQADLAINPLCQSLNILKEIFVLQDGSFIGFVFLLFYYSQLKCRCFVNTKATYFMRI